MKCIKGFEVQALKSAAGYYIGTVDSDGFPNCRITSNYAKTEEEAKFLLPLDRQTGMCTGWRLRRRAYQSPTQKYQRALEACGKG